MKTHLQRGMSKTLISVIIVNYNGGRFLQDAIDALARQSDDAYELILVDNASTDGSLDTLCTDEIERFQLIRLEENIGFAAGNNLAARQARGSWLALLNPDTKAAPNWLTEYRRAIAAFPKDVMFAGSTTDMREPGKLDGAGDCYAFFGLNWRGGYKRPEAELPAIGECFSPCGASALFHKQAFLDVGGFDERFFCYCEDVDLGFRLRLAGHRCIFWPDAEALHYGSGTTHTGSPFAVRHGTRNRLWVFVKNMPPLAFWLLLPVHIAMSLVLLLRGWAKGQGRATLQGLREGVGGLSRVWQDRRKVQQTRRLGSADILKAMSWNILRLIHRKPDVRAIPAHIYPTS